jgi:hypothetical protein
MPGSAEGMAARIVARVKDSNNQDDQDTIEKLLRTEARYKEREVHSTERLLEPIMN